MIVKSLDPFHLLFHLYQIGDHLSVPLICAVFKTEWIPQDNEQIKSRPQSGIYFIKIKSVILSLWHPFFLKKLSISIIFFSHQSSFFVPMYNSISKCDLARLSRSNMIRFEQMVLSWKLINTQRRYLVPKYNTIRDIWWNSVHGSSWPWWEIKVKVKCCKCGSVCFIRMLLVFCAFIARATDNGWYSQKPIGKSCLIDSSVSWTRRVYHFVFQLGLSCRVVLIFFLFIYTASHSDHTVLKFHTLTIQFQNFTPRTFHAIMLESWISDF